MYIVYTKFVCACVSESLDVSDFVLKTKTKSTSLSRGGVKISEVEYENEKKNELN